VVAQFSQGKADGGARLRGTQHLEEIIHRPDAVGGVPVNIEAEVKASESRPVVRSFEKCID